MIQYLRLSLNLEPILQSNLNKSSRRTSKVCRSSRPPENSAGSVSFQGASRELCSSSEADCSRGVWGAEPPERPAGGGHAEEFGQRTGLRGMLPGTLPGTRASVRGGGGLAPPPKPLRRTPMGIENEQTSRSPHHPSTFLVLGFGASKAEPKSSDASLLSEPRTQALRENNKKTVSIALRKVQYTPLGLLRNAHFPFRVWIWPFLKPTLLGWPRRPP